MLIREQVRIAAVDQRGVVRLTALNGAAEIVYQRFPHQVFREVAPRLRTVIRADACQNAQPRLIAFRL